MITRILISLLLIIGSATAALAQSDSTAADTVLIVKAGDTSQLSIMLAFVALLILLLFLLKSAFKRGNAPN
jgi:hypothetical protein